jgi:ribosome-binding protein aMBF1 (putative translation factor)
MVKGVISGFTNKGVCEKCGKKTEEVWLAIVKTKEIKQYCKKCSADYPTLGYNPKTNKKKKKPQKEKGTKKEKATKKKPKKKNFSF